MWHMLFYVAFLIYFFFNKLAEQNPKTKEKNSKRLILVISNCFLFVCFCCAVSCWNLYQEHHDLEEPDSLNLITYTKTSITHREKHP